jgi:hypothetical protein
MGGMHEVRRRDGFRFRINWFGGGDSQTHGQHGNHISLLSFFQNKESRLKVQSITESNDGNDERINYILTLIYIIEGNGSLSFVVLIRFRSQRH